MPRNYANSRLYRLQDQYGHFFIYSTTQKNLRKRLYQHKICSMKNNAKEAEKYFQTCNWQGVDIIQISVISANDRFDLKRIQALEAEKYLNNPLCLNFHVPPLTSENSSHPPVAASSFGPSSANNMESPPQVSNNREVAINMPLDEESKKTVKNKASLTCRMTQQFAMDCLMN